MSASPRSGTVSGPSSSSSTGSIPSSSVSSSLPAAIAGLRKHGKYVLFGGLGCWYLDIGRLIVEEVLGLDLDNRMGMSRKGDVMDTVGSVFGRGVGNPGR